MISLNMIHVFGCFQSEQEALSQDESHTELVDGTEVRSLQPKQLKQLRLKVALQRCDTIMSPVVSYSFCNICSMSEICYENYFCNLRYTLFGTDK